MSVSIKLSKKEAAHTYHILKAIDEGLITNPLEDWELDHFSERIVDKNKLKTIIRKIEQSLPKKGFEKTRKTILRRKYHTFNNKIDESIYRKIENAFNNQKTIEIEYFDMTSTKTRKRQIDVYHKTRKYVIGYCHLRSAMRKFRTSRIVTAKATDKKYDVPADFDKNKY